jgi:hypothetical protein
MAFTPGTTVLVRDFAGQELSRIVIADRGASVLVCNRQEFRDAAQAKREPSGIGFPRCDVKPTHSERPPKDYTGQS